MTAMRSATVIASSASWGTITKAMPRRACSSIDSNRVSSRRLRSSAAGAGGPTRRKEGAWVDWERARGGGGVGAEVVGAAVEGQRGGGGGLHPGRGGRLRRPAGRRPCAAGRKDSRHIRLLPWAPPPR